MRISTIKLAIIGALSIFMVASVSAQTKSVTKTKAPAKAIEKAKVPKVVTEEFIREYPIVEYDTWYGYPTLTNEMEWYDYNPMYFTYDYPEYYVVEFAKDKVQHKAVYTKEGKKVAIHHKVKAEAVPAAVNTSLKSGIYKTWKETGEKEEIEKVTTKEKVYKITVEKDGKKHNLYYDSAGKLLKGSEVKKF
jgi:hypothetical protein